MKLGVGHIGEDTGEHGGRMRGDIVFYCMHVCNFQNWISTLKIIIKNIN